MKHQERTISIIGAGALGMLFGTYSYLSGYNVQYITRRKKQASLIEEKGISVTLGDGQTVQYVPQAFACDEIKAPLVADLVLVVVKQPQLLELLPWLSNYVAPWSELLFLMNGLGHKEKVEHFLPKHTVMYGITQCGATRLSDWETMERGKGVTMIGSPQGLNPPGVQRWKNAIAPYLEIVYSDDIEAELWSKAMINACINPITALFKVPNGALITNKHLNWMMREVYEELIPLFSKVWGENHPLVSAGEALWKKVINVCQQTADNRSSMLQDIVHHRKTEIEALNGYFVHLSERYGLKLTVNQLLYKAILALEEKSTTSR